jgi:hypothetical protein
MKHEEELKRLEQAGRENQEAIEALKAKIEAEENEPWEPSGGDYSTFCSGSISDYPVYRTEDYQRFGASFKTEEQAKAASKRMRFFNRLCKLAEELNPSGKVGGMHYVFYVESDSEWRRNKYYTNCRDINCVFETDGAAQRAAEIMNRDWWEMPW